MNNDIAKQPRVAPVDDGFPSIWTTVGFVVFFALLLQIVGLIGIGLAVVWDESGREAGKLIADPAFLAPPVFVSGVVTHLLALSAVGFYLRSADRRAFVGLSNWGNLGLLRTLALVSILIGIGLGMSFLYTKYVIPDIESQREMRRLIAALPDTIQHQATLFLLIVIVAPMSEEILFRGLLQTALTKYLPIWASILSASAIFALVHIQPFALPQLMMMGALFGILYHITASLRVTILAHMVNNAAALLLT